MPKHQLTSGNPMSYFKRIGRLFYQIISGSWVIAGFLLIFILGAVILDVILRLISDSISLPWVVEISEYLMLGITFFGGAQCLKTNGHVKIDFIFDMQKHRTQLLLRMITSILGALAFLTYCYFAGVATWFSYQRGTHLFKFLKIPKYVFTVVIFFGSFLIAMMLLRQGYECVRMWKGHGKNKIES